MWLNTIEWLKYTKGANMGDLTANFDLEQNMLVNVDAEK